MQTPSLEGYSLEDIASFYDTRMGNGADLNVRSANGRMPAHHHAGIARVDEQVPRDPLEALSWLYRSEQALCDLAWHVVQGVSQRLPQRLLDLGCGEGATAARFCQLASGAPPSIVGITLSEQQRAAASSNCPEGRFIAGDMVAGLIPCAEKFDVALAIESTEYLGAARLRRLMECAGSWLAPAGLLVIVAGSRSPSLPANHPMVKQFDSHYRTQLLSTADYRRFADAAQLNPVVDVDLAAATLPYWRARRDHKALRNSLEALIERTVVDALESGVGEYRMYGWYRQG